MWIFFWFLGSNLIVFGWGQNKTSEDIISGIWERYVIDHTANQLIEKIIYILMDNEKKMLVAALDQRFIS